MHIIDCEQGSDEWFLARMGKPSASRFKDIMTSPQKKADKEAGKLSQTAKSYMNALIAEKLLMSHREIKAKSLDWGKAYEPLAREDYIFDCTDGAVQEVGFVLHNSRKFGASPDSLVGENGGMEIKCPENPGIHITAILEGMDKDHIPQVQGGIWICERDWWDFVSFRNDMPAHLRTHTQRIYRDEVYIRELSSKVNIFTDILGETFDKLNIKLAA
jgi:hypothetical protein